METKKKIALNKLQELKLYMKIMTCRWCCVCFGCSLPVFYLLLHLMCLNIPEEYRNYTTLTGNMWTLNPHACMLLRAWPAETDSTAALPVKVTGFNYVNPRLSPLSRWHLPEQVQRAASGFTGGNGSVTQKRSHRWGVHCVCWPPSQVFLLFVQQNSKESKTTLKSEIKKKWEILKHLLGIIIFRGGFMNT